MVAGRNRHPAVFKFNALAIAFGIGRQDFFDGQVAGFLDNQIEGLFVEIPIFGMPGELSDIKLFIENKVDIPAVG